MLLPGKIAVTPFWSDNFLNYLMYSSESDKDSDVRVTRTLMSELLERPYAAVSARRIATGSTRADERVREGPAVRNSADGGRGGRRCYGCGGPHLVRHCPEKDTGAGEVRCWACGRRGHLLRSCPSGQGNLQGGACAPEAPQGRE